MDNTSYLKSYGKKIISHLSNEKTLIKFDEVENTENQIKNS